MKNKVFLLFAAALAVAPATAATWATDEVSDRYAAGAILQGNYSAASQRLFSALSRGDRRPEVLLNLAAVQVGRQDADDARALYAMVLAQPNIDMRTAAGTAWSHDIAQRGLARLGR
jgi:thioredoxin-like negative regulator of GroEL